MTYWCIHHAILPLLRGLRHLPHHAALDLVRDLRHHAHLPIIRGLRG